MATEPSNLASSESSLNNDDTIRVITPATSDHMIESTAPEHANESEGTEYWEPFY